MACSISTSTCSLEFEECPHMKGMKLILELPNNMTFTQVFERYHATHIKVPEFRVRGKQSGSKDGNCFDITRGLTIGEVISAFDIRCFEFKCLPSDHDGIRQMITEAASTATKSASNAFQILMAGGKGYPNKKDIGLAYINPETFFVLFSRSSGMKAGVNKKDEMFNMLIDDFVQRKLSFAKSTANSEGSYFIQVLCNALWYLTNQHSVIDEASRHKKNVQPVPVVFSKYEGFNDLKRKKLKSQPLKLSDLKMHAEAIYSLMLKPVVNSSPEWKTESDNFKQLANCMLCYSQYLEEQQRATTSYHALTHPVRTKGEHATVEHRSSGVTIKLKYSLLDAAMREAQPESPVFFDESVHVEEPFGNSIQKYRFFNELQLTVPVDIIRYCPGGPQVTTVCIFKVMEGRPESVILTQGAKFLQKISSQLKEVHTRAQRAEFDSMVNNIAHISPAVKAFIYRTLTNDASAPVNPVMEERLRLISLGNTDIIDDLRHLNTGRPHAFDNFFQKLQEVVEEVTAADDRRHNVSYISVDLFKRNDSSSCRKM
ncbi:uncharacterized protein LOC133199978 [Saccostrea echinata]|uniref:uncharacterized protein LOC133199978 n=1 Tax=Saccostrea echinata TaxID=191078 RepID=UPI002A7F2FA9|nr:uncharacterized protein LOC133199978 [Saccostrea echinata]